MAGMLDSLKGALGFGSQSYDQPYDDYDEYGEGYDDYADYADDQEPSSAYDRYDTVTTRSAGTRSSRATTYTESAASSLSERRGATHAPLINFEDVRSSTQVPDSLSRDPLPSRRRTGSLGRNSVGRASDFALSGTENEDGVGGVYRNPADDPSRASRGYNALFDSTPQSAPQADKPKPGSKVGQGTHPASGGYDPYQSYTGAGGGHSPNRRTSVIAPAAYSDVESVARSLKAGDAVVLSLRATPSDLSKRILDFSFGVASALDGSVERVDDKVFAITRGAGLSDAELGDLRARGVVS